MPEAAIWAKSSRTCAPSPPRRRSSCCWAVGRVGGWAAGKPAGYLYQQLLHFRVQRRAVVAGGKGGLGGVDVPGPDHAQVARGLDARVGTQRSRQIGETRGGQAVAADAAYSARAKVISVRRYPIEKIGHVAVVSAGTADQPVAEEAALTAEVLGCVVSRFSDVGVAGLHRLLAVIDEIRQADVIIAVAGMEGALVSVLGGLVDKPVLAVPSGIGYGANFGGVTTLLAMLNSCASGVAVHNIGNGFGAGFMAATICRQIDQHVKLALAKAQAAALLSSERDT